MLGLQGSDVGRSYFLGQPFMIRRGESESCQQKPKTDARGDTGGRANTAPGEADAAGAAPFLQRCAQTVPKVVRRFEVEGIGFHSACIACCSASALLQAGHSPA